MSTLVPNLDAEARACPNCDATIPAELLYDGCPDCDTDAETLAQLKHGGAAQ